MSFGELGRTIGSNWLCLDNMFSWSPRRHSGGRTSESDGASEELWRRAPYYPTFCFHPTHTHTIPHIIGSGSDNDFIFVILNLGTSISLGFRALILYF